MSGDVEVTGRARPTLESVAARAGVSRGTASRALGGGGPVSPRTRAAVLAAAEALGYRPNLAARSLVLGRTGNVGLLVSESDDRLFTDPFFAAIVRGVHGELADAGIHLVLTLAQTEAERRRAVRFATSGHVDGLLLISVRGGDPLPEALAAQGLPVVLSGRRSAEPAAGLAWVDADNRDGARQAVDHLVRTGRRRIATVSGPADLAAGRDRMAGWRDVLRAAGLPDDLHTSGEFDLDSGHAATHRLLERDPHLDAVFAGSDLIALGVLQALREAGRQVPDDVAVVGFDDIPAARGSDPPLTTVRQPVEAMGARMAAMLLARLDGTPPDPPWAVLPTALVVRSSA
jgi:DNA-binding LacI/PurR family transcriptional regulator